MASGKRQIKFEELTQQEVLELMPLLDDTPQRGRSRRAAGRDVYQEAQQSVVAAKQLRGARAARGRAAP
jgi:hypothetical protein